mmetsp:Transcript_32193/g.46910  ORF Transcript_32193/g.46910 Transcript_32193/m.46910 type:complete len:85 (+) Transcript_32193:176-430(+)
MYQSPIGYIMYFRALRDFLYAQPFASSIDVIEKRDSRITGNFEVTILNTKELIHSARRGHGFLTSEQEKHAIAIRIEDAIEETL